MARGAPASIRAVVRAVPSERPCRMVPNRAEPRATARSSSGFSRTTGFASLPSGDLALQPEPQRGWLERAAIEKEGIDGRASEQESREVAGHRAVRRRRGGPFAQCGLVPSPGLRIGGASGEKAVHQNRNDLATRDPARERGAEQPGAAPAGWRRKMFSSDGPGLERQRSLRSRHCATRKFHWVGARSVHRGAPAGCGARGRGRCYRRRAGGGR